MKNIAINIKKIKGLKDFYKNKNFISLLEIISDFQELIWENEDLKNKIKELENKDINDGSNDRIEDDDPLVESQIFDK